MRHALLLAGLVLASSAVAAPRLVDLSRDLAAGADELRVQVERGEPDNSKLGKKLLKNLLTGGDQNRDARDPIFRDFDVATRELTSAAKDLDRGPRGNGRGRGNGLGRDRDNNRGDEESERRFIRQFRTVEKLSADIDRTLNAPTARNIFATKVIPTVQAIRTELPTLAAFRDMQERKEDRRDARERQEERREERREDRADDRRSDRN